MPQRRAADGKGEETVVPLVGPFGGRGQLPAHRTAGPRVHHLPVVDAHQLEPRHVIAVDGEGLLDAAEQRLDAGPHPPYLGGVARLDVVDQGQHHTLQDAHGRVDVDRRIVRAQHEVVAQQRQPVVSRHPGTVPDAPQPQVGKEPGARKPIPLGQERFAIFVVKVLAASVRLDAAARVEQHVETDRVVPDVPRWARLLMHDQLLQCPERLYRFGDAPVGEQQLAQYRYDVPFGRLLLQLVVNVQHHLAELDREYLLRAEIKALLATKQRRIEANHRIQIVGIDSVNVFSHNLQRTFLHPRDTFGVANVVRFGVEKVSLQNYRNFGNKPPPLPVWKKLANDFTSTVLPLRWRNACFRPQMAASAARSQSRSFTNSLCIPLKQLAIWDTIKL
uniref:Uncharacterized protein n=1 Tax=Anopheles coluzzii TaxID=1518534 RepID=A0A8W7PCJ4_ANOCL